MTTQSYRRDLWLLTLAGAAFLLGCAAPLPPARAGLTPAQMDRVGRRIWQNECAGTVAGLTSWNGGEDFASLGVGHFIWYPAGRPGPWAHPAAPVVARRVWPFPAVERERALMGRATPSAELRAA